MLQNLQLCFVLTWGVPLVYRLLCRVAPHLDSPWFTSLTEVHVSSNGWLDLTAWIWFLNYKDIQGVLKHRWCTKPLSYYLCCLDPFMCKCCLNDEPPSSPELQEGTTGTTGEIRSTRSWSAPTGECGLCLPLLPGHVVVQPALSPWLTFVPSALGSGEIDRQHSSGESGSDRMTAGALEGSGSAKHRKRIISIYDCVDAESLGFQLSTTSQPRSGFWSYSSGQPTAQSSVLSSAPSPLVYEPLLENEDLESHLRIDHARASHHGSNPPATRDGAMRDLVYDASGLLPPPRTETTAATEVQLRE